MRAFCPSLGLTNQQNVTYLLGQARQRLCSCARSRSRPAARSLDDRQNGTLPRQTRGSSLLAGIRQLRNRHLREGRASVLADRPLHLNSQDATDKAVVLEESQSIAEQPVSAQSSRRDSTTQQSSPEPSGRKDQATGQGWLRACHPSSWSPRTRGLILLNGLILLLASNWVVIKESQQHFDALVFGGLRFTVAGLAFSPFLKSAVADTELLLGGVELGVWSGLGYFTQALGLMTTDASRGSFISAFTVIVVPLLAGLSGKGVKPLTWASAIIALVGVGLLEQGGKAPNIGDAWGFASAVLFGIQVFRTEHFSRVLPQGSTLKLMSVIMATIAVMSASAALLLHPHETEHVLSHISSLPQMIADGHIPWMAIFYTGLLSTDVALWIEVIALHDVSSTDAAIIYTLEPVLGALFAYLVLDERWGPAGWVGAALIVFSSLATQLWGGDADGGAPNSAVEKVKTKNR